MAHRPERIEPLAGAIPDFRAERDQDVFGGFHPASLHLNFAPPSSYRIAARPISAHSEATMSEWGEYMDSDDASGLLAEEIEAYLRLRLEGRMEHEGLRPEDVDIAIRRVPGPGGKMRVESLMRRKEG